MSSCCSKFYHEGSHSDGCPEAGPVFVGAEPGSSLDPRLLDVSLERGARVIRSREELEAVFPARQAGKKAAMAPKVPEELERLMVSVNSDQYLELQTRGRKFKRFVGKLVLAKGLTVAEAIARAKDLWK